MKIMTKNKIKKEYRIIFNCNTAGQSKIFEDLITAFVKGNQSYMQSVTGRNYRNCSVELKKI